MQTCFKFLYFITVFLKIIRICVFGNYIFKFACEVCWCVCVLHVWSIVF